MNGERRTRIVAILGRAVLLGERMAAAPRPGTSGDPVTRLGERKGERVDGARREEALTGRSGGFGGTLAGRRWDEWAARLGGVERLERRIRWGGWSRERVRAVLADSDRDGEAPDIPAPAVDLLEAIVDRASNWNVPAGRPDLRGILTAEHPLPFEDVWLPAVAVARDTLLANLRRARLDFQAPPLSCFHKEAYDSLERALLHHLASIGGRTLLAEYDRSRPMGPVLARKLWGDAAVPSPTSGYRAFVGELLQDGLLRLFEQYPMLARLAVTTVSHWAEGTAEFIRRFAADRTVISAALFPDAAPGRMRVTATRSGMSDPHDGGRRVIEVQLEAGRRVLYKPRDCSLGAALTTFLSWCNDEGVDPPFRLIRHVLRDGYAWVEHVPSSPCRSVDEAVRFYRRSGMLLAVLHVLGCTDCHDENVVASGECLTLVDDEALLQPRPGPRRLDDERGQPVVGVDRFADSVIRTGLLPDGHADPFDPSRVTDVGALASGGRRGPRRRLRLHRINTDDMYAAWAKSETPAPKDPIRRGAFETEPWKCTDAVSDGFGEMYRFLQLRKDEFLRRSGPLDPFTRCTGRFIFRSTYVYTALLDEATSPEHLRSGIDFSLVLERLGRAFVAEPDKPTLWPLFEAEMRALARGDVPRFGVRVNSSAVANANGDLEFRTIEGCFQPSGLERCRRIASELNDEDLRFQQRIVRGAMTAYTLSISPDVRIRPTGPDGSDTHAGRGRTTSARGIPPLSATELVSEARRIARLVDAQKFRAPDGSTHWIGLRPFGPNGHYRLFPLGHDLYGGRAGVALFFAALGAVRVYPGAADVAKGALHEFRSRLRARDATAAATILPSHVHGGMTGLGSALYALTRAGTLTGDASWLDDARRCAHLIAAGAPDSAFEWGVVAGSAGTVLSLLAFYDACREEWVLGAAARIGDALVGARRSVDGLPPAWPQPGDGMPLTGFSHGAAGVSYALMRLHAETGMSRFRQSAEDGHAYERAVFDRADGNWPDYRRRGLAAHRASPTDVASMVSWCHGAPGISLSRIALVPRSPAPGADGNMPEYTHMRAEIEAGLATTMRHGHPGRDALCCGETGITEILWEAGRRLGAPRLERASATRTARLVRAARQAGTYALFDAGREMGGERPPEWVQPGFMQGWSGIGFSLLRRAYPDKVPSALLLE